MTLLNNIGLARKVRGGRRGICVGSRCSITSRQGSGTAPVDKLSVLLVSVFAVAVLGERPSLREWTGIAKVGAGVFVLAFKR